MPTDSDVPLEKITEFDSRHPRRTSSSDSLLSPTAALDPADLRSGYVLAGRYEVIRKLGQGGFGTVFLARDSKLEREVAIKRHRGMDKKDVELLRTEAKRIASMDHPSVVSVYDLVDDVNDGLLIIMQFINGRTLSEHLRERRPSTRYLFSILEQVCKGLAHAHARNLVHRDIKPSNILLGADSRAYLSDFGLAILRADTLEYSVCGTPGYMAPEQVRGESHRIDRRTDIWAMGTLLYEIFVGTLPFKGLSKREILERTIRKNRYRPARSHPTLVQILSESYCVAFERGCPSDTRVSKTCSMSYWRAPSMPMVRQRCTRWNPFGYHLALLDLRRPEVTRVPYPTWSRKVFVPSTQRMPTTSCI